ncbi:MAG: 50S ribosomal protein L24 [Candidatus ainarchaeum sp.]|nr:50S ribosomal protein L24 [Candidatus ainarchaeum sp.]
MKRDTERKKFYEAKLHELRSRMHVHLSKELKAKLKTKSRALLANKGDNVKIMRGSKRGKTAKIGRISYAKGKIYLEGMSHKNAKGTEILMPFQPSNLLLVELNMSESRKKQFGLPSEQKGEVKV